MPRNKSIKVMQSVSPKREEVSLLAPASSEMDDNDTDSEHSQEQTEESGLTLILKELREFRKDSIQQLKEIREEINKTNTRIEEVEKRIDTAETRIQVAEEAVTKLLKLQIHLDAKLTDLEGRSRRENIRIHGVKEGTEEESPLMVCYVECLLREGLGLQDSFELRVERAHHALPPKPPSEKKSGDFNYTGKELIWIMTTPPMC